MSHVFCRMRESKSYSVNLGLVVILGTALGSACVPAKPVEPPTPLPAARYDFTPSDCQQPGSTRLTLAVIAPRWQTPTQATSSAAAMYTGYAAPRVFLDLANAMRGDFLELASCRGYLAKGPYDSFEAMVFPDREASQLLLEPDLQIDVSITNLEAVPKAGLAGLFTRGNEMNQISGQASIGGRVTLTLKEPVTNTRMWTRSIDVPSQAFAFTSQRDYSTSAMTEDQARVALLEDGGFLRLLLPKLEGMYGAVLQTAENYLDAREVRTVATQAADVRKRGAVTIPR